MDNLKIGNLITTEQYRDAIHIAVAPVVAVERLAPGTHVGFIEGTDRVGSVSKTPVGIVDPYLKQPVFEGERFWLFLYPQTVTSLRHEWSHPAFVVPSEPVAAPDKTESEAWLRAFCGEHEGLDYNEMLRELVSEKGYVTQHGYQTAQGHETDVDFQHHFKVVTGVAPKGTFSCSC